uniref:hypothetical protein n=1 Tax=Kitasatospora indigofera TaxID=67307 RepID=UPI002F916CC1
MSDRRALHSPFSSSPLDAPLPAERRDRLMPVERAPFLQAPAPADEDQDQDEHEDGAPQGAQPATGRRRLGPGGATFPAEAADR